MRRRTAQAAILATLVLTVACASAPLRRAALVNQELAKGILRVQAVVEQSYRAGELPRPARDAFQRAFLKAADAGLALNRAILASDQQAALAQVLAFTEMVNTLIADEVVKLPASVQTTVLIALESLRAVLLSLTVTLGGA